MNQHPPVHTMKDDGLGKWSVFCWIPVPLLTTVVSLVAFFSYLPTNNSPASGLLVGR